MLLLAKIPFQFHKGTIRTSVVVACPRPFANFNSIKVRLELSSRSRTSNAVWFQFHKGTIRTWGRNHYLHQKQYFNSIKVRLELPRMSRTTLPMIFQFHKGTIRTWHNIINRKGICEFQFHKGTIRTPLKDESFAFRLYFNSIKVRLERCLTHASSSLRLISIP